MCLGDKGFCGMYPCQEITGKETLKLLFRRGAEAHLCRLPFPRKVGHRSFSESSL